MANNEAGVLFRHKSTLMQDEPDYLLCLRYNICSSFPVVKIIESHKQKEDLARSEYEAKVKVY